MLFRRIRFEYAGSHDRELKRLADDLVVPFCSPDVPWALHLDCFYVTPVVQL